jgi:hypothetical protein
MIRRQSRKLAESLDKFPITFEPRPIIDRRSKLLVLGCCFALRVKEWLVANGFQVLNNTDLGPNIIRGRPEFDPRIYYNTFCTRYEFDRIAGEFSQDEDDIWEPHQNALKVYQDPYRRMLAHEDRDELWQRIHRVNAQMQRHIAEADCLIVTLGLTEVFFQQHNGNAIAAVPGYSRGGGIGCEFRATEYPENLANMKHVVDVLREVNPQAQLIIAVSPVPLAVSWSGYDQIVANADNKCTLRAVAGALARKYEHVHYFPALEHVMHAAQKDVFLDDGRHVSPNYVAGLMADFQRQFVRLESPDNVNSTVTAGAAQKRGPHFIDMGRQDLARPAQTTA